jgi:callose synthase
VIAAIFAEIKMSMDNSSLLIDFKMDHLPLLVEKIERLAELLVNTSLVPFPFFTF